MNTTEQTQAQIGKHLAELLVLKAQLIGIDAALIPPSLMGRFCDAMWQMLELFEADLQAAAKRGKQ